MSDPVIKKSAKRLHVIPLGDLEDHEAVTECWCHPVTHDGIVTHNAKDCREQMERAGKPTGKIWCRIAEKYDPNPITYLSGGPGDPLQLLRRIGTPKAFMDLEGVRIICADFMAKWDARNS